MYVGHFAIGLAIKAKKPNIPVLPILLGVGFLDVLDGLFTIAGINHVTPDLHALLYLFFDLTFIDWDHSLLMAVVWSLVWAAFFMKDKQVAVIAALAVFSHFLVDWPLHNSDLALYPYSQSHLGLGLWGKLGINSWFLEGMFAAVLGLYAWRANARRGVSSLWPSVLLLVLFLQLSPWLSPMWFVAQLQEPWAHLIHGALVTVGFLVPGLLFCWLVQRAEDHARASGSAA